MKQETLDKIQKYVGATLLLVAMVAALIGVLMISNCAAKTLLTPSSQTNVIVHIVGDTPTVALMTEILVKTSGFCRDAGKAGVAEIYITYDAKHEDATKIGRAHV